MSNNIAPRSRTMPPKAALHFDVRTRTGRPGSGACGGTGRPGEGAYGAFCEVRSLWSVTFESVVGAAGSGGI